MNVRRGTYLLLYLPAMMDPEYLRVSKSSASALLLGGGKTVRFSLETKLEEGIAGVNRLY